MPVRRARVDFVGIAFEVVSKLRKGALRDIDAASHALEIGAGDVALAILLRLRNHRHFESDFVDCALALLIAAGETRQIRELRAGGIPRRSLLAALHRVYPVRATTQEEPHPAAVEVARRRFVEDIVEWNRSRRGAMIRS